jgi:very-short-patch-repair endonuclease
VVAGRSLTVDRAIERLAAAQHGMVARRQLLAAGVSAKAIAHRIGRGRLVPVHRGVYAWDLRRPWPDRSWWMAAVLASGATAVLSGRSAARLHGLLDGGGAAEVALLRTPSPLRGVRGRRVRVLSAEERTRVDGIACTTVARTLLDLAWRDPGRTLDRALRRSIDLGTFDRAAVDALTASGRPGATALRTALAELLGHGPAARSKSELELRFFELLDRHGFDRPAVNVSIDTAVGAVEVDTLWRARRLSIELDGWWTHRDRRAARRAHERDLHLRAAGFEVLRLDWLQVVEDEARTVRLLRGIVPAVG